MGGHDQGRRRDCAMNEGGLLAERLADLFAEVRQCFCQFATVREPDPTVLDLEPRVLADGVGLAQGPLARKRRAAIAMSYLLADDRSLWHRSVWFKRSLPMDDRDTTSHCSAVKKNSTESYMSPACAWAKRPFIDRNGRLPNRSGDRARSSRSDGVRSWSIEALNRRPWSPIDQISWQGS
jgi:hypothetical protein